MAKNNIVAFIDAPDPDNFVMVIALARLNPEVNKEGGAAIYRDALRKSLQA